MGIKVALEHRTSYSFDRLVEVYPHVVRLRPAPHCRTPIEAYSLEVEPADHFVNWQQDAFGNFPNFTDRGERRRAICALGRQDAPPEGLAPVDPRVEVLGDALDGSRIAAHNDVVYQAPAREGWEGLPLGNGTFGAQVWPR